MKKVDIRYLEQAEANIRHIMQRNFKKASDRQEMLEQLGEYFRFLCGVQGRRHLIRLAYYTAAYEVYNYLRVNRQLRQDVEGVDPEVRTEMEQMLSKLLVAYGTEKD